MICMQKFDPKLQNMSKILVLRIILHGLVQGKYSRGSCRVSLKIHWFYCDQGNSKKKLDGSGDENKENKKERKRRPQYSKCEKA